MARLIARRCHQGPARGLRRAAALLSTPMNCKKADYTRPRAPRCPRDAKSPAVLRGQTASARAQNGYTRNLSAFCSARKKRRTSDTGGSAEALTQKGWGQETLRFGLSKNGDAASQPGSRCARRRGGATGRLSAAARAASFGRGRALLSRGAAAARPWRAAPRRAPPSRRTRGRRARRPRRARRRGRGSRCRCRCRRWPAPRRRWRRRRWRPRAPPPRPPPPPPGLA